MSDTAGVQVEGLHKSYGKKQVLGGIDLWVPRGTIFALLGPNGAGKTTLINILSTLAKPDSGRAWVAGFDVIEEQAAVKASISLTGQYAAVDEVLTGAENLQMIGRLLGLNAAQARERTSSLLGEFDLQEAADERVKTYSGGMRRRLDLAISLIATPPVIFLDEPTTGLDTRSRQGLWQAIQGLASQGITIMLTTQYLEEADVLADRVAVINNGVVVAEGTPTELKAQIGGAVVELHDSSGQTISELATDGTVCDLRRVLDGPDLSDLGDARLTVRQPSMDDVFLALTDSAELELAS